MYQTQLAIRNALRENGDRTNTSNHRKENGRIRHAASELPEKPVERSRP